MLSKYPLSEVEKSFLKESGVDKISTLIPYLTVDNFPKLGLLTACRFLEWAAENPNGVISLPTGKSPEFFIKWTQFLLDNWDNKKGKDVREKYGLGNTKKPVLKDLTFVQIDEFYRSLLRSTIASTITSTNSTLKDLAFPKRMRF